MKLIITTTDCINAQGFISKTNPVAIAFQKYHPEMEDVQTVNNRLTATREGYHLRFAIQGFTPNAYKQLLSGDKETHICELKPQPIRL